MERAMSVEDKIRRAEEIYYKRRAQEIPRTEEIKIRGNTNLKKYICMSKSENYDDIRKKIVIEYDKEIKEINKK